MAKKNAKKKTSPKKKKSNSKKTTVSRVKRKRRIKYGRILMALIILILLIYILFPIISFNIKNIYIKGNEYLTDQEVIEIAGIENYPSTFNCLIYPTKKKLEQNVMIKKANVTKKGIFKIYIEVIENSPLFYSEINKKTILKDLEIVDKKYDTPILLNYVPDKIYERFIKKMRLIDKEVLMRISEIEYKPNNVDKNRFLLSMQDGNYVYLTLSRFENINNYVEIISKFGGKKGILYLDSGEYFKIYE